MWPFSPREDKQTIRMLRSELDQLECAYMGIYQRLGASEAAMKAMQKALDDNGLAEIAKAATAEIADIYARNSSGVRGRNEAIFSVIHREVSKAARGESAWDTGAIAREAYGD